MSPPTPEQVGDNLGPDFQPVTTVAGEPIGGHPLTQQEGWTNPALAMCYDGEDKVELDPGERPGIYRAVNISIMDGYGPMAHPIDGRQGTPLLSIPPWWLPFVPEVEGFISSLSDELAAPEDAETIASLGDAAESLHVSSTLDSELFAFVIGEDTVATAIARRSRASVIASFFVNDLYDGWDGYDAEHPPVYVEATEGSGGPGAMVRS